MNIKRVTRIGLAAGIALLLAAMTRPAPAADRQMSKSLNVSIGGHYTFGGLQSSQSITVETHTVGALNSIRVRPIEPIYVPPPRHADFRVDVYTDRAEYSVGDSVNISFRASDDAYVYIFNTDAGGITRQIFPNYYDRDNFAQGGRRYSIPDRGYSLAVEEPVGRESLRIVAYRQRWRALDIWHRYDRLDPFPRSRYSPDDMRRSVEKEALGLSIRPVPRPQWDDYAEDWAYFTTAYPRHWRYDDNAYRYDEHPYEHDVRRERYERNETYRLEGLVRISTSPHGAYVYIDGSYCGRSPGVFPARPGQREITIHHPAYGTRSFTLNVSNRGTASLSVSLQRF